MGDFFKGWKINLFAVFVFLIGVLDLVSAGGVLPVEWMPWLLLLIGVVNFALRTFYTDGPAAIRGRFK